MNTAPRRRPALTLLLAVTTALLPLLRVHAQPLASSLAEIKIAAEAGDPAAQDKLAEAYAMRLDSAQAEAWYRKAASQNYLHAQAKLGNMLLMRSRMFSGRSTGVHAAAGAEGVRWLLLAANQGVHAAQADLASVYLEGRLMKLDLAESYKWGDLAAQGAPLQIATIAGSSSRDTATLKMTPDQIEDARKRVAGFVPRQLKMSDLPAAPEPAWLAQIKLMGLSGRPDHRFAIINSQTFQKSDVSPVKAGTNTVTVRCLEIRDASVIVAIDGLDGTRELNLP